MTYKQYDTFAKDSSKPRLIFSHGGDHCLLCDSFTEVKAHLTWLAFLASCSMATTTQEDYLSQLWGLTIAQEKQDLILHTLCDYNVTQSTVEYG